MAGPVRSPEYGPGDESALKEGLRVVAIVPARGGTDRVPYLNIKRLGDGPLLAHTLDAARGSRYVDRVVVSTDDAHVAEVARAHGAEVPFLRPPELAADLPSLKPVVAHAVHALEDRLACLLAHHGMIAIGPSLSKAMWLAVEVETLARQYHGCLQIGKPPLLSKEEIENVRTRMAGYGHAEK